MESTRKRILSIFAAAALTVCPLPQNAQMLLRPAITASAEDTSGTCGEDVNWEYDAETETLTISGTGEMDDFYDGIPVWDSFQSNIRKVIIEDGVTSIGAYAFHGYEALQDISIPESVQRFGINAVSSTAWLTAMQDNDPIVIVNHILISGNTSKEKELTVPDGVTSVNDSAFRRSEKLEKIVLPDSVTRIGQDAFYNCYVLESVTLSEGLTDIGNSAFQMCYALKELVIPDGVAHIGQRAFQECTALERITIPESVTSIDEAAFDECTALTITGCSGSYAESYATENNIPFEPLGDALEKSVSDWNEKQVISRNTAEAELVVRVGDIDACNDENAVAEFGYDPFTAKSQYAHGYPWQKDENDPAGTDRIFVGSKWNGDCTDGYSSNFDNYKNGSDTDSAYGDGALSLTMEYDASGIDVKNVILQLCIDDFQAVSWDSEFTVTLNGKDAPFIAELLNHTDQTGPTAYIVSAMIPSGFFADIASGKLTVVIDETTGIGDGYAIDFAKLLINYDDQIFTGTFSGKTEPGATVRLLGTSTTVTASSTGVFTFNAIPGINAVRASKTGFVENYDSGIVLSAGTEWKAEVPLTTGQGSPDIDFSKFAETGLVMRGDYNGDGKISAADAVLLARFVSEDTTLKAEEIGTILSAEPDYDVDGVVTVLDVTALLKDLSTK